MLELLLNYGVAMSTSYVIRPGETDYDAEDRVQGNLNLPLNRAGEAQVEDLIDGIRNLGLKVIYTSPNEPALSTARRIGSELDMPVKVLDELTNVDLGLWQGLTVSEIRTKQPKVYKRWGDVQNAVCPPEGETCEEARCRVEKVLKKPIKKGKPFAVVASEPLASLVADVLSGCESHHAGPLSCCTKANRVEQVTRGDRSLDAAGKTC